MKTIRTRFGDVTYNPDKVVRFPEGLIGFEQLREFVVLPGRNPDDPLFRLQSVEEPHVLFLLIDPTRFFPDYRPAPDPRIRCILGISADDPCFVMTTITFHKDQRITLNLLAPILYSPKTDRAVQIVLDQGGYQAGTPIPSAGTNIS